MIRTRQVILASLAAIIVMTSVALGMARGQPGPAGAMVICAGTGAVVVPVDADGNPAGPRHYCPDCALSLLETGAFPAAMQHGIAARCGGVRKVEPGIPILSIALERKARAPPRIA